jgi:hypothetical protein
LWDDVARLALVACGKAWFRGWLLKWFAD